MNSQSPTLKKLVHMLHDESSPEEEKNSFEVRHTNSSFDDFLTKKVGIGRNFYLNLLGRFMKRHIWRCVALLTTLLVANETALIYLPLLILVVVMVIVPALRSNYLAIPTIFLAAMWLILFVIDRSNFKFGLTDADADLQIWIGLQSLKYNWIIWLPVGVVCLQFLLYHTQRTGLFDDVTFEAADDDGIKCSMFLFQCFFLKFGLEASLIWSVLWTIVRLDIVGMVYLFSAALMTLLPRATLRWRRGFFWKLYGYSLGLIFLLEYLLCLRLLPWVSEQYPWTGWQNNKAGWFFLAKKMKKHTVSVLIGDLVQLMLVWSQANVFQNNNRMRGGDNKPGCERFRKQTANNFHSNAYSLVTAIDEIELTTFVLPHSANSISVEDENVERPRAAANMSDEEHHIGGPQPVTATNVIDEDGNGKRTDFVSDDESSFSCVKQYFFFFSHWTTLIIVLISASFDSSIFSLVYIIGVFVFFWKGSGLYVLKPLPKFLLWWKCLQFYNIFVLAVKAFHGIKYGNITFEYYSTATEPITDTFCNQFCSYFACPLITDFFIFASLLFQIRIINSWYFQQVVLDYKADRIFETSENQRMKNFDLTVVKENQKRVNQHLEELKKQTENADLKDMAAISAETRKLEVNYSASYHHVSKMNISRDLEYSPKLALFRKYKPFWQPSEWFFTESIIHAHVAHRHAEDKKKFKKWYRQDLLQTHSAKGFRELSDKYHLQHPSESKTHYQELEEACIWWKKRNFFFRTLYPFMAQSKMLLFVCLIAAHAIRYEFFTFMLSFFVFLWGVLAVPQPSKLFYICYIISIEGVIIIRLIMHFANRSFDIFPSPLFGTHDNEILESFAKSNTAFNKLYDIFLLTLLFLHRYKLTRLGQSKQEMMKFTSRSCSPFTFISRKFIEYNENIKLIQIKNKELITQDWYTPMVVCDVIFIILLVAFSSDIGEGGSGDFFNDVRDSSFPPWLVASLGVLLLWMVIDRLFYLSKFNIIVTLMYYIVMVLIFHVFFYYYIIISTRIRENSAKEPVKPIASVLYLIKCVHFLMFAWHIKHGYPGVSSAGILHRKIWWARARLYYMKIFNLIPLLHELRTTMDFCFTTTSLTLEEWCRMVNYRNEIAVRNCSIQADKSDKDSTQTNKPGPVESRWKGLMLCGLFLVLIFIPLILYTFVKNSRMPPKKVVFTIHIQGYPVLYHMEAQYENLLCLNESEHDQLLKKITAYSVSSQRQKAITFLNDYDDPEDVFRVIFPAYSLTEWSMSAMGIKQLLRDLRSNNTLTVETKLELQRSFEEESISHVWSTMIHLTANETAAFRDMIERRGVKASPVSLKLGLSPYIIAPAEGRLRNAQELTALLGEEDRKINVQLQLIRLEAENNFSRVSIFWHMTMNVQSYDYILTPIDREAIEIDTVQLVVFVNKVLPSLMRRFFDWMRVERDGGIIALMTISWIAAGRYIFRPLFDTKISQASVDTLPNVDTFLFLFRDIDLAREHKEWYLEKRLFQKLIFLFRSPETMISWSRYCSDPKEPELGDGWSVEGSEILQLESPAIGPSDVEELQIYSPNGGEKTFETKIGYYSVSTD